MSNLSLWRDYLKDIESSEQFITFSWLHLVASALERRVWLHSPSPLSYTGIICPNMFFLFTGPPAAGKTRPLTYTSEITRAILDESGMPSIKHGADSSTLAAMIDDLVDAVKTMDGLDEYQYNSLVFHIKELGTLFQTNSHDLINTLNDFYDALWFKKRTSTQTSCNIPYICVNMIAGTTPDFIKEAFSNSLFSQGFMSRWITVFSSAPRFFKDSYGDDPKSLAIRAKLVEHIKRLMTVSGEVTFSPEAKALRKYWIEPDGRYQKMECRPNKSPILNEYYGRKRLHWFKLATALHFSDYNGSMEISGETMQAAFDLLGSAEIDMHKAFDGLAKNPLYAHAQALGDALEAAPDGMSVHEATRMMERNLRRLEVDEVLEGLKMTRGVVRVGDRLKIRR